MLSRSDRARQFLPFDALNGFQAALREKEKIYVDRVELSEEKEDELARKLMVVDNESIVEIVYYTNRQYLKLKGNVKKVEPIKRKITINETSIKFMDILSLDIL